MLDEAAVRIGEVVGRLPERETSPPGAQNVAALGGGLERLLAVFLHLALLFFRA